MGYVIAIVIGVGLYLAACLAAITYVVAPVAPFLALASAVGGLLLVAGVLGGTLLRVEALAAPEVTPADAVNRLSRVKHQFGRDPAWPHYLFPQCRDDLRTALARTGRLVVKVWTEAFQAIRFRPEAWWFWPLLLLPLLALVTFTAAVLVFGVTVYGLVGVTLGVSLAVWLVAVAVLRGADHGVRLLRGAKASCPICYWRGRLPAYRCPCGAIHHDIRAGKQGVFTRRCECGKVMPTTVLKAATGLVAVCQDCDRDLREGAGVKTDVNIPVFGPASAGKTRLIYAGIVALGSHMAAVGGTLEPDPESRTVFAEATKIARERAQTVKTDARQPQTAITVHLETPKRRQAQLHLVDAAGELYADRGQSSELRFLDDAEGLVFVLDPFSIPSVVDELRGALAARLTEAQPAREEPEGSYQVTAQWLRDQGVKLARKPLAVAVVKADLLLSLPLADGLTAGADGADIARWLRERSLDNLLDGMERDFGKVTYHLVSSLDDGAAADGTAGPLSPARPLLWLLGRSGVPVAEGVPVVAS